MRTLIWAVLVAFSVVCSAQAQPTWPVHFYVDMEHIAELRAEAPFVGPVKLAGRSGPSGDDDRSGLIDNMEVCFFWNAHGYCCGGGYNEPGAFDSLDSSYWGCFGGPSPRILEDFGNPSPCLMTSGDASYASGVYSFETVCLGGEAQWSWYFFVDVYVDSTADYHTVEFGIGDADAPSGPPGQETLGHVAGVTWTKNTQGESVLQLVTDIDYEEVPASQWLGGWHKIGFAGAAFSAAEAASWTRIKAMFQ